MDTRTVNAYKNRKFLGKVFGNVPNTVYPFVCLAQPGLSAERFVPCSFSKTPGARMYRTGDLARWNDEGKLEFVGRVEHQVKVRGYRIELGAIESRLMAHPQLSECVVVTRGQSSQKRLVA